MKPLHDLRRGALDLLLEVTTLLQADMEQALAAEGLTVPRAHLLWVLHHGGPVTQRALAQALDVSPRNVTGLVDGLVASGHVTREAHPSDRRATLVTLTPSAARLLRRMAGEHGELAERLFGGLKAKELEAFLAGLDHAAARLREALEEQG